MKSMSIALIIVVAVAMAIPGQALAQSLSVRSIAAPSAWIRGGAKPKDKDGQSFETLVDLAAECGITEIHVSGHMFLPMAYVDFAAIGYPEAVVFSKEEVERNRQNLDQAAQYAAGKGIRLLPAGYEHNVPASFYRAHEAELNPGGMFTEAMQRHGGLDPARIEKTHVVGNLSWNRPVYKKFWIDAYREYFRVLPHVSGARMTYGEWAWAYEEPSHMDNVHDYLATFWKVLREARGSNAVLELRDWYVKAAELTDPACPRVRVVCKEFGHDATACTQVSPWLLDYVNAEVPVLGELNLSGAENTRPLLWFDPEFIQQRVEALAGAGAEGFVVRVGPRGSFIAELELRALKAIAVEGRPFGTNEAVSVLRPYFGEAAPDAYLALQQTGVVLREYTKLYSGKYPWWQSDGVSINSLHTGFRGFNGFQDPMDYLRCDAVGLPEYVASLGRSPEQHNRNEAQWKQAHLLPPPAVLERIRSAGEQAKQAGLRALATAPPALLRQDSKTVQQLAASALVAHHTARLFCNYTELAIAFWRIKGGDQDPSLEELCLSEINSAAIEWIIIGKLGDQWFPSRINSDYAERRWQKYAELLKKELKLVYEGPAPDQISVESLPGLRTEVRNR